MHHLRSKVTFPFSLQRSVDLDKLQAPPGHVVTGVKFRNLGGHLNLELRVSVISLINNLMGTTRIGMGGEPLRVGPMGGADREGHGLFSKLSLFFQGDPDQLQNW